MKIIIVFLSLMSFAFAEDFSLKAINLGNNIEVQTIDMRAEQDVFSLKLRYLLDEGININHKSFTHKGKKYILNIFANQKYKSKEDLKRVDPAQACKTAQTYERLYQISSEISFSISLGTIENGFLKNLDVLEGVEDIVFKKRATYRCR